MKVLVVHIWLLLLLLNQKNSNLASGQCYLPTVLCCPGRNDGCHHGCYCDEYCMTAGDCCPDYYQTCNQSNLQTSSPSLATALPPSAWITPYSPNFGPSSLSSSSSQISEPSSSSQSPTSSSANSEPLSPSPTSPSTTIDSSLSSPPTTSSSTWTTPHSPNLGLSSSSSSSSSLQTSTPSSSSAPQTSPTSSSITSSSANSESSSQSPTSPSTTFQSTPSTVPSLSSPSPTSPTSSSITSLSGQCSVPTVLCCPGHNNSCYRGCFCDEACIVIGDCCPDYNQICIQLNSEPSSPSPTSPSTTLDSSLSSPPTTSSSTWTTPHSPNLGLSSSSSSSSPSQTSPTTSFSITSSSVCNTCTENEVCQERGGVYGCGCLLGQRPNPEIFDAVESCASSTGSMSLSRCQLFESGFHPEYLHLNDPSCRGTLEKGRLVFHFDNKDHICGTTLMSNRTHFIYQNSIQCTPRNTAQSVITRERWMNITFSCVYPLIQTLSMPMGIQAESGVVNAELPAGQGTYQIRMIPYHDAQFTTPYDGEVQVQVNQQMYVAVEVEGVDRNQIATVLDNCWATPVNDIDYHLHWNIIIRECPNPEDGTVEVLQNGIDTKSHFSFRMFTFSGISDHIFLHCQVHLCLVQNGRCALSCDHRHRRRRRRFLDFHHSASITMGLMRGLSNPVE